MERTRTTKPIVCVGRSPCLTPLAATEYHGWHAIHYALVNTTPAAAPYCPRRLSGCPWPTCTRLRKGGHAHAQACAPAGLDAPVRCHDRRLDAKTNDDCWVIERRNANATKFEAERAAQCSGSLSEEQFVLAKYFGGGAQPTRGGTFLELGAFDGWKESNTLHLETCLGWRGLLIDGQPTHLEWMRTNRPAAISLGVAICPRHGLVNYSRWETTTSGIVQYMARTLRQRFRVDSAGQKPVPCGPLGSWLSLLRVGHIDFFSLDVQGAEHMVLGTLDWSKLSVGVLLSECKRLGCSDPQDAAVRALLEARAGLRWAGMLRARHDVWDGVFVNLTLWERHHGGTR